jgi:hypothetical protein
MPCTRPLAYGCKLKGDIRRRPACRRLPKLTGCRACSRSYHSLDSRSLSGRGRTDLLRGRLVAVDGDLSADGMKFAVVIALWNAVITERLLDGALDALLRSGANRSDVGGIRVPCAWEVPGAARTVANLRRVDGVVTLGYLLLGRSHIMRRSTTRWRVA